MLYEHASAALINHWDVNRQLRDTSIAPYIYPEDKIELLRRLAARMQGGAAGLVGNYIMKDDLERDFEDYVKDRYEVPRADAAVVARTTGSNGLCRYAPAADVGIAPSGTAARG